MTNSYEEGSPDLPICFLAEAPGRTEIRRQQPLCGPSGELFNEMLHAVGITRRECYILNTFPVQVEKDRRSGDFYDPRNHEVVYYSRRGFTAYGRELAAPTEERLRRFRGNIICALGDVATTLLLGKRSISKWRGSLLLSEDFGNRKVLPTFHPAAVLHGMFLWKYAIMSDFAKLKAHSKDKVYRVPNRHLHIAPGYSETLAYLRGLKKAKRPVSVDIEAGYTLWCIALTDRADYAMSIPFVDERGKSFWSEDQERELWLLIASILEDPAITKIGQNFLFDINYLMTRPGIITQGPVWDTMIAASILRPDFPKGLDYLASIYTDEPYYKDEGKKWKHPFADLDNFWRYNAKDACVTFEIWGALAPDIKSPKYWPTYQQTVDLFPALLYMQYRGVKVDWDALQITKKQTEDMLAAKTAEFKKLTGLPDINPLSPVQISKYFYGIKGLKPYLHHRSGSPTTDDTALSRIYRRYRLPEAKLLQEVRSLSKLLASYLEIPLDKDHRMRCFYNPRGTTTGRLSSQGSVNDTGSNMQNLHPMMLRFLVSDREVSHD